jgi:hypothetical protein
VRAFVKIQVKNIRFLNVIDFPNKFVKIEL